MKPWEAEGLCNDDKAFTKKLFLSFCKINYL